MNTSKRSAHEFNIPVMGTGFTIDTPLHIARYGISSVISLVDDILIEQIREYHSKRLGVAFEAIGRSDEDSRAKRITAYLNFLNDQVAKQVADLQSSPFEPGSEITRYYDLLPECSLKKKYSEFIGCKNSEIKSKLEKELRESAVPGTIDVNIMTKLDRVPYRKGKKVAQEYSDAMCALRGYALSDVSSSIIFSAGLNPHLYGYLAEFSDFIPNADGISKKNVVLKVSDYRSAIIQGRFLAKRGIWVSEFRVESGLNCGGHAFASKGSLMGPILEEFKNKGNELSESLHVVYNKGLEKRSLPTLEQPRQVLLTVQGGIGSSAEHKALLQHYKVDLTGWATPFLLVPEVTCVDDTHLERLCAATEDDVYLGDGSPMGIPFWTLRTSESEVIRRKRIAEDNPGSLCPKGFLKFSEEFSEMPLCKAARNYLKQKLAAVAQEDVCDKAKNILREEALAKACICHDLAGGATGKYGIDPNASTTVCASSNIAYFSKLASLEEMIGHIYGRISLFTDSDRPHMFIREIILYVEYLLKELERFSVGIQSRKLSYYSEFKENLLNGVHYYQDQFNNFVHEHQDRFSKDLLALKTRIENISIETFA